MSPSSSSVAAWPRLSFCRTNRSRAWRYSACASSPRPARRSRSPIPLMARPDPSTSPAARYCSRAARVEAPGVGHLPPAQLDCSLDLEHARLAAIVVEPGEQRVRFAQPHTRGVQRTQLDLGLGGAHHQLTASQRVGGVLRRERLLQSVQRYTVASSVEFESCQAPQHARLPGTILQRRVAAYRVRIGRTRCGPALRALLERAELLLRRSGDVRGPLAGAAAPTPDGRARAPARNPPH